MLRGGAPKRQRMAACTACRSTDLAQDDDDNWFCRQCFAQVQDITLLETNDANEQVSGAVMNRRASGHSSNRRSKAEHRKRRKSEAALEARRIKYSEEQLLAGFQCVLKAQVAALIKTFGCSAELRATIGELWFGYLERRAAPTAQQDLPEPKLPLTVAFVTLGCFLRREPLLSVDLHRAMCAGTLPYLEPGACLPSGLDDLGLQDAGGALCSRDTTTPWRAISGPAPVDVAAVGGGAGSVPSAPMGYIPGDRCYSTRGRVPSVRSLRGWAQRLAACLGLGAYALHCPLAGHNWHREVGHRRTRGASAAGETAARDNHVLPAPAANPPLIALRYITSWGLPPQLFGGYLALLRVYTAIFEHFWPPQAAPGGAAAAAAQRPAAEAAASVGAGPRALSELETMSLLIVLVKCFGGISSDPPAAAAAAPASGAGAGAGAASAEAAADGRGAVLAAMQTWQRQLLQHGAGGQMLQREALFRSHRALDVRFLRLLSSLLAAITHTLTLALKRVLRLDGR